MHKVNIRVKILSKAREVSSTREIKSPLREVGLIKVEKCTLK